MREYDEKDHLRVSKYSRGQQAQITKRIRLRGSHNFTAKDKKCILCGHYFRGPACQHTVEDNQEVLKDFSPSS